VSDGCPELPRAINEGDPVDVARVGGDSDGPMDIRVDDFKKGSGLVGGGGGEGVSHHLGSKTRFADGVWLGGRGDHEASDQVLIDHLPEDREAGVTESTMPELQVHRKCGGGGKVGCLRDGNGCALQIGDSGGVDLGLKHRFAIKSEGEHVLADVDQEVPVHGKEED